MYSCTHLPAEKFPKLEEMVRLWFDKTRKIAWLELRNTPFLVNPGSQEEGVVQVLIGAVPKPGKGWQPIRPADATGGQHVSLTGNFSDPDDIFDFQRAIVLTWSSMHAVLDFHDGHVSGLAKGTTFGKSLTSASFVAKALKTGFDAIGRQMSSWPKFTAWSIDDLQAYANRRLPGLKHPALIGFLEYTPNMAYHGKEDGPRGADNRKLEYIPSVVASSFKGSFTYETELNEILPNGFDRVIGYGFRGETRPPGAVKSAGGFLPNYARPAHISEHDETRRKALVDQDMQALMKWDEAEHGALNLQEHIRDPKFRGFVSTSKSIAIAKEFATDRQKVEGWVYACLVVGAIKLPRFGKHPWLLFNEQELAMPGMIDWENVVACRQVQSNGTFKGPVYMRPSLDSKDPKAAKKIWKLLSGKSQNPKVT